MYSNYQYMPNQHITLKGRPVSSLDEVRAIPVDFDGSLSFFPDIANRHIYTKQINMDGSATILMYELKDLPKENPSPNFITREEFEATINDLKTALKKGDTQYEF